MSLTLYYGQEAIPFGPESLISLTCTQSVDPIYGGLPKGELVAELYTWVSLCPQKEEELALYWDSSLLATYYIQDCTQTARHRYRLRANPRTEYLQTRFVGKIYQGEQVDEELEEMLGEQKDLVSPNTIAWQSLTGYIGPCTRGQALEQIAFGTGSTLVCSNDGSLIFQKSLEESARNLTKENVIADYQIRWLPHYTRFELASHRYTKGQIERVIKDRMELSGSPAVVTFQDPYWWYNTDVKYACEIVNSGSNFVEVYHNKVMTLYAKPWVRETTYHTLPGVTGEDPLFSHVLSVRDRTLIGPHNVQSRLRELQTLGSLRQQIKVQLRGDAKPWNFQPGDPVTLPGYWGIVTGQKVTVHNGRVHMELTALCKEV